MKINWNPQHPDQQLIVTDEDKFEKDYPDIASKSILEKARNEDRFCRALLWQGVFSATMVIPKKEFPIKDRISFSVVLSDCQLFIIKEKGDVKELLEHFFTRYDTTYDDPMECMLAFFSYLIQNDVYYLEEYNEKLEDIEEEMLAGRSTDMERYIMTTRKDMNILGDYYLQLSAMAETIQETIVKRMENNTQLSALVSLYASRISQLSTTVESVKDYTSQIWNLRQAQLSDRQNQISQILTIITTVFLPLTLITGWFGMNFINMPLVKDTYGYPLVLTISIFIVILELIYIWKKKLWK